MNKQYPRWVPNPLHDPKDQRSTVEILVNDPDQHAARSAEDYAQFTAEAVSPDADEVTKAVTNAVLQERMRCANIAAKWPSHKAVAAEIGKEIRKNPDKSVLKAIAAKSVATKPHPEPDPDPDDVVVGQQQLVGVGAED